MIEKEKVFFVIPAYNEENSIGKVIKDLLDSGFKNIIIVNDGSKDNTSKEALKFPVFVLNHLTNRGQGAALRTGIEFACEQKECKFIVTYDADGQHKVEDVQKMLSFIQKEKLDIVLGSRFLKTEDIKIKNKVPLVRLIILRLAVLFLRFMYGLKVSDAHNGLRVFTKECAPKLLPTIDNMAHASEILYLIRKAGLKYAEFPVEIIYDEYSIRKGQKNSAFLKLAFLTILHKIKILLFEKE